MNIVVMPGDDIGPEIVEAAMQVVHSAERLFSLGLSFETVDVGMPSFRKVGSTLTDEAIEKAVAADGVILGPCGMTLYPPRDKGGINVPGTIRKRLDLYANLRPARSRAAVPDARRGMDMLIVRENTEGFYSDRNMFMGIGEFMPTPDLAISVRKITRNASRRISRVAFEWALRRRKKVTAVGKQHVLQMSDGLFMEEAYAAAKARIFTHCDTAVVNMDDPWVAAMPRSGQRVQGFSLRGDADYMLRAVGGETWLCAHGERLLPMSALRTAGLHNAANALASLALGDAIGLPRAAMLQALQEFTGLPHRSQWVRERRGVRFVDDSKGTNVGATLAAVAGLPGTLVLVAGGDGKGQDFTPLAGALAGRTRLAALIGRDAPQLAVALEGACPVRLCASLEEAVVVAADAAQPGDTVLLSPACASFDMFRDYAHRGAVFAAAVGSLPA